MNNRLLSVLSLVLAVAALGHSFWLRHHVASHADDALRRREAALVRAAAPKVSEVCQDLLGESFKAASFHPTTLEELARPLVVIATQMSPQTRALHPAPSADTPGPTLAAFSALPHDITFPELVRRVGESHDDIGSGVHIYRYLLPDGSTVLVGTPDRQRIIYVTHVSGAVRTPLFPKAK